MEEKRRYTKLDDGSWVLESTSPKLLADIQLQESFIDDNGVKHEVIEREMQNEGIMAPYLYVLKVKVRN